jgi:peptidoglycan/LPS O-acetylase OafA/YrhL
VAYRHYGIHAPVTVPFRENGIQALIENIFLVQALGFSSHPTSFNGPSWSISVEFYTYLIFGAAVLYLRSMFLILACTISAGSFLALVLYGNSVGQFSLIVSCLAGFFLGCITQRIAKYVAIQNSFVTIVSSIAFFGFLFLDFNGLIIYPLSSLLILSVIDSDNLLTKALLIRPLRWLGKVSYSLYMSHAAVIWIAGISLGALLRLNLSASASDRYSVLSTSVGLAFYFGTLVLILVVAELTYVLVEAPLRKWSRGIVTMDASARSRLPVPQAPN